MTAGFAAASALIIVTATLQVIIGWPSALWPVAAVSLMAPAAGLMAPGAPQFSGLGGRALVKTLSASAGAVVISFVYLVVVRGLGNPPTPTADRELLGLSMLAAGLAAVGFGPARRRLLVTANRLVFGVRDAPDEMIRAFASRLSRSTPMDDLLLQLCESLLHSMDLIQADVYAGRGESLEHVVGAPSSPRVATVKITERERPALLKAGVSGNAWLDIWLPEIPSSRGESQIRVASIRNAGELLGLLVVERSTVGEPFSEEEETVLADLAREVGLALHNIHLDSALQNTLAELRIQADELRESRARLVASGDEERRRLERDIHDGAQQSLSALAIELRLARDLISEDPEEAGRMLDRLGGEVQNTIQELRELAHGIYPPLLAYGGLGPALEAAAGRSPLPVSLDVQTSDRFDQGTEAAVYFCCLEALQNSTKHAPAARISIKVWREPTALSFLVVDDGPGFDPDTARRGHGLMNMTDRLGAIGGTVTWESAPGGGVQVSGTVPLSGLADTGPGR